MSKILKTHSPVQIKCRFLSKLQSKVTKSISQIYNDE